MTPIFDLFSKRQKRLRGEYPEIFKYDKIPEKLKIQIIHILLEAFGEDRYSGHWAKNAYKEIHRILCKEYGAFTLDEHARHDQDAIFKFFLACQDTEQILDVIELTFKIIDTHVRTYGYQDNTNRKIEPDDAISELNTRFKENGVGYQFESSELIRLDSTYLHSEVIKPVLSLLTDGLYKGANEEFLKAHEHYRHGRNKECLAECLKSFESVMKAICEKRKWSYNINDTAKKLINICLEKELIPLFLQTQFTSLQSLFESGIPAIRNKMGGHGQGAEKITVEDYIAGYALNLTASNIFLLVNAEKNRT